MSELSAEDAKLVTLARATMARTGAAAGAAVRDLDGRTYAASSVSLPSLRARVNLPPSTTSPPTRVTE